MADDEWELVHAHTRADMLRDGWLVDVTELAAEAGFRRASVAFTSAAWMEATSGEADVERVRFRARGSAAPVGLVLHIGPGDHGEPVFTVLLDGED